MTKKQKLELTWIGKDEQPVLEPCILIEAPDYAHLPRLVFALALPRLRWYGANM